MNMNSYLFIILVSVVSVSLFITVTTSKKIVVIGANGKTGKAAVDIALSKGIDVVAVTRSGVLNEPIKNRKLKVLAGDVKQLDSLEGILKGADAVIFAASASKEGGTPAEVDNKGLENVAIQAVKSNVSRLVIVSSGAVTKPYSPVYLFLNLFGGIMREKALGEERVRRVYMKAPTKLGYTIVRPGGLTEDPSLGVEAVELNQGDEKSGRIARADVAAVCVESIFAKDAARATLEVYYKDTGKPLAEVGLSNIFKMKRKSEEMGAPVRYEKRGSTWAALFKGLVPDAELKV